MEHNATQNKGYILSIDQGTTSTRLAIIDHNLKIIALEQIEHEQIHLHSGWTEHDPLQLYMNVNLLIMRLHQNHKEALSDIKGIGITNQRETCLAWNRSTGEPLSNAIVWHDTRTLPIVDKLIESKGKDYFRPLCGLPINTYFSAVKIRWMIDNIPEIKERIVNKTQDLAFGTIDSWLIYVKYFLISETYWESLH